MFELLYNFSGLNKEIFLTVNHATNVSILPFILQLISWPFGISKFAIYYVIFAIYFYWKLKRLSVESRANYFWPILDKMALAGIIYACFGFTYAALKFGVNLPRPFCSLPPATFSTIINTENERCLSSFPSAHTGLAVLITYLLWPYLHHTNRVTAILVIILVGISRMTLAMHYPADIIYSIFIAGLVIIIGRVIFKLFENNMIRSIGKNILRFIV